MMNRATIVGHLGGDPEVRAMQNGDKVANFSVATTEKWKDKNSGEKKERTEWHRIAVFSQGLVGICEQYLRKGSKVLIEGKLTTRKWQDQDGKDMYSTEINLSGFEAKIVMLGDGGQGTSDQGYNPNSGAAQAPNNNPDDEIPF